MVSYEDWGQKGVQKSMFVQFHIFSYIFTQYHTFSYISIHFHTISYIFMHFIRFHTFSYIFIHFKHFSLSLSLSLSLTLLSLLSLSLPIYLQLYLSIYWPAPHRPNRLHVLHFWKGPAFSVTLPEADLGRFWKGSVNIWLVLHYLSIYLFIFNKGMELFPPKMRQQLRH